MTSIEAPRIATWLLKQFGCSPNNDAILGDIVERYREGHSRFWYWRQVSRALVSGFYSEVATHKLLMLRAAALGWVLFFLYGILFRESMVRLYVSWARSMTNPLVVGIPLAAFVITSCIAAAANGWVIGRLHRPHGRACVIFYMLSVYVILSIASAVFVSRKVPVANSDLVALAAFIGNLISAGSTWIGARLSVSS